MPEPIDMAEYIASARRYIEPRLDDMPPPVCKWALPVLAQWSPDLLKAVNLYVILDVMRTQLLKTEAKFSDAKDKLGDADSYELKRVMALIQELKD